MMRYVTFSCVFLTWFFIFLNRNYTKSDFAVVNIFFELIFGLLAFSFFLISSAFIIGYILSYQSYLSSISYRDDNNYSIRENKKFHQIENDLQRSSLRFSYWLYIPLIIALLHSEYLNYEIHFLILLLLFGFSFATLFQSNETKCFMETSVILVLSIFYIQFSNFVLTSWFSWFLWIFFIIYIPTSIYRLYHTQEVLDKFKWYLIFSLSIYAVSFILNIIFRIIPRTGFSPLNIYFLEIIISLILLIVIGWGLVFSVQHVIKREEPDIITEYLNSL
jgi:hypothetical protein